MQVLGGWRNTLRPENMGVSRKSRKKGHPDSLIEGRFSGREGCFSGRDGHVSGDEGRLSQHKKDISYEDSPVDFKIQSLYGSPERIRKN
jgi:hypothetical protein